MNGRISSWIEEGRMSAWRNDWMDGLTDGRLDGRMVRWLTDWIYGRLAGWLAGWTDGRKLGWMDRRMVRWLKDWMYGRLVDSGHAFLLANPVDENDEYDVCACDARENETQMLFAEKKKWTITMFTLISSTHHQDRKWYIKQAILCFPKWFCHRLKQWSRNNFSLTMAKGFH